MKPETLFAAVDATWPAAEKIVAGPWTLRRGAGGGKRVSSATRNGPAGTMPMDFQDVEQAASAMAAWGQDSLFMLRPEDQALDRLLDDNGYRVLDRTHVYCTSIDRLTDVPVPRVTTFCVWEPLSIMNEIWLQGGIGPERLAVMARADVMKTAIFARWNEKPAATAFVALQDDICMVHAVEVLPEQRRQGVAQWVMRAAAFWGQENGASHIALLCTQANTPANNLYSSLGFELAAHYHYRSNAG